MDTTDYIDVLAEAANEAALDPDNLSTAEFAILRRYAKKRLETAWRFHLWPDLVKCEQRFYRLPWSATAQYAAAVAGVDNAANEVWWALTGQYYVALNTVPLNTPPTDAAGNINLNYWASTSQFAIQPDPTGSLPVYWPTVPPYPSPWTNVQSYNPLTTYVQGNRVQYTGNVYQLFAATATGDLPTDAASWGLIPPFDAYVPYEQAGQIPFTVVEECFSANPRTTTRGNVINWFLSERGIEVLTPIPFAWVQYRQRAPKLNGSPFSATAVYQPGAQMYYSSATLPGNFYTCLTETTAGDTPDSEPAEWALVPLPRIFHAYLVLGMAADWSKYTLGTNPEAEQPTMDLQAIADKELDDVKSLYVGQMGMRVKTQVRTR